VCGTPIGDGGWPPAAGPPGRRGTGKLTRMLADGGVAAIAVEPSASMCAVLRSVTRVPVIAAVAEALPFANNTLAWSCPGRVDT
jgi:hypothetical protein